MKTRTMLAAFALIGAAVLAYEPSPRAAGKSDASNAPAAQMSNDPSKQENPPSRAVLDINRASKDELKSLPGIGETFAQRIIDGRPYERKTDLKRRNILPPSTYEAVKQRITARHEKAKDAAAEPTK
jgi:DNA uptake protein ComE-like DNA-binding protein